MMDKDPQAITVRELCVAAHVNRSTFYDRFGYRNALIEAILSDCMDEVLRPAADSRQTNTGRVNVPRASVRRYVDRFLANETLMRFCLCPSSELYRSMIIEHQVAVSVMQEKPAVSYYAAYFQNAGVLNLLIEWIREGEPLSKDELVEIIHQFSKAMYMGT